MLRLRKPKEEKEGEKEEKEEQGGIKLSMVVVLALMHSSLSRNDVGEGGRMPVQSRVDGDDDDDGDGDGDDDDDERDKGRRLLNELGLGRVVALFFSIATTMSCPVWTMRLRVSVDPQF